MPFQKGQSGNPKGRPPKNRALTTLLEKAANQKVEVDDRQVAIKQLVADLAWKLAATGEVTFPDGTTIQCESIGEWRETVKWLYQQIDGPPKAEVDVTSAGEKLEHAAPAIFLPAVEAEDQGDA